MLAVGVPFVPPGMATGCSPSPSACGGPSATAQARDPASRAGEAEATPWQASQPAHGPPHAETQRRSPCVPLDVQRHDVRASGREDYSDIPSCS